jgi:hypothetical protein
MLRGTDSARERNIAEVARREVVRVVPYPDGASGIATSSAITALLRADV